MKLAAKVWVEHTHDRQGLDIVCSFGGAPTEDTYEYLQDFFRFRLEQLKKSQAAAAAIETTEHVKHDETNPK